MYTTKTPCNNMALNVCTWKIPRTKSSLSEQGRGGLSIYAYCTAILLWRHELSAFLHCTLQCAAMLQTNRGHRGVMVERATDQSIIHLLRFYCMLDKFSEHRKLEYTLLIIITLTKFAHWALHKTRYIDVYTRPTTGVMALYWVDVTNVKLISCIQLAPKTT